MKKSNITVNIEESTLTISKTFYKKASIYGTPEYDQLRCATRENENFKIIIKHTEKKTYKNLTFDRMAEYIRTQPDSNSRMMEFEAVKAIAETKGSKYPLTKKWFLLTYPEYRENCVSEDEVATLIADGKAEAERIAAEKLALIENGVA